MAGIGLLAVLGAWLSFGWLVLAPLGDVCGFDADCRSKVCIQPSGVTLGTSGEMEVVAVIVVPSVITQNGLCSKDCREDSDCGGGFVCEEGEMLKKVGVLAESAAREGLCLPILEM